MRRRSAATFIGVLWGLWGGSSLAGCHSGDGATPGDGGLGFIPDAGVVCPPATPLLCNGACVAQDDTHCATCTDVCQGVLSCQTGECLCKDPKLTLCNGACLDLATDAKNCGRCSRSCLGTPCSAGTCAPVRLASATMPFGIAVDATSVYWTSSVTTGAVMSVPVGGGAPQPVVTGQNTPRDIGVSNGTLYFTNDAAGTWQLMEASTTGTGLMQAYSGPGSPKGLSVNNTSLAWIATDTSGGDAGAAYVVYAAIGTSVDGGAPNLISLGDPLRGITSNGLGIFWTDGSGFVQGYVFSSQNVTMPQAIANANQIAADATSLYVTTTDGKVLRVDLTTANPTTIASGLTSPYGIAVDDVAVYYTDQAGSVLKASKAPVADAGPGTLIASGQANPTNIVVDNAAVYWTNDSVDAGAIMRTTK